MAKRHLVVDIDDETQTIQITDEEDGVIHSVFLQSLALIGGDARNNEIFIKMFGASSDAAWAYGQGFRIAHSPEGGRGLKNFFKQCAAHVCHAISPNAFQNEVGAEAVLNRWEDPDQTRWFGQDSEDVLEDKQVSEGRKKKRWDN